MITFIVIGRNEGWKLTKCIDSIYIEISNYRQLEFEVLYVDSRSDDDSIARVLKYPDLKVYLITGSCNAAIARNIGAGESKGDLLFFLDGDMELCQDFLDEALRLYKLNHDFISGQIEEYYYDENWKYLGNRLVFSNNYLNTYNLTNGGAFIIKRSLWESVDGMRTKYNRSQDIDLNYRLIKRGHRIFRSDKVYIKHNTIQYNYHTGMKTELKNFKKYLFKGLLIRDHFLNTKIIARNIRINYSLFLLIISIFLIIILENLVLLFPYLIIVFLRSFRQFRLFKRVIKTGIFHFFFKYVYQDVSGILGMLFFYPKNKSLSYCQIKQ